MPRKLPSCAVCGESLVGRGHIHLSYENVTGKPGVGWCTKCSLRDDLWDDFMSDLNADSNSDESISRLMKMLRKVERRGPGRLIANKGWVAKEGMR